MAAGIDMLSMCAVVVCVGGGDAGRTRNQNSLILLRRSRFDVVTARDVTHEVPRAPAPRAVVVVMVAWKRTKGDSPRRTALRLFSHPELA
jgi:hypothetical protein